MIDEIAADIALKVQAQLPYVTAVKYLARQDPSGVLVKEDAEEWVGIDDRTDGAMYIRLRDGWEESYTNASLTSAPNMEATAYLRAVFMHRCGNEIPIARFLALALMNSRNHSMRYATKLRRKSTDKQFIYGLETKRDDGMPNDTLRLVMIDFDVTYKESAVEGTDCIPNCHVC